MRSAILVMLVLAALAPLVPSAAAASGVIAPSEAVCLDAASACVFTGDYAAACVASSFFVCAGWFQADHPGCPRAPQNGFDTVGVFGPAGFVRYYGGCHYVDGAYSTDEGLGAVVADPTSGAGIVDVWWHAGDDPSGHSCAFDAAIAGAPLPTTCPLGQAPPYVLPALS